MSKPVIIVESAAKTRTIANFLGGQYELAASLGHVRDLPTKDLGVDVDHDFSPTYRVMRDKSEVVKRLKTAVKNADQVYLATDPDREGEAIAWHLEAALGLKNALRIEFNEITRAAVEEALQHPRQIDMDRVNAQQARRVLDRLVGYRLSPLLWRKVKNARSAGRVQSVAVRLIVDREREIQAFVATEYWNLTARLHPEGRPKEIFEAKLDRIGDTKVEVGTIGDEVAATELVSRLESAEYTVTNVGTRDSTRRPPAPHITSTLQRDASNRLRFRTQRTMSAAQTLYEGVTLGDGETVGLITYMRTDSTRVANEASEAAKAYITETWGKSFAGPGSRGRAVKGAQDAHECIRPTSVTRTPDEVDKLLSGAEHTDARKLYRLIWTRFVASQMAAAKLKTHTVEITADDCLFKASGTEVVFPGYMALTGEPKPKTKADDDDEAEGDDDMGYVLPAMAEGDDCGLDELTPSQHFTQPPPRYTEASLVKALEEQGIGRPSTYAPILSTITQRRYVSLEKGRFVPTGLGEAVTDALVQHFPSVMDVGFTAELEGRLDDVETGKADWVALLREFYEPFNDQIEKAADGMERVKVEAQETDHDCPKCGSKMLLREGRYGQFLGCSRYPECDGIMRLDRQGNPSVPAERIETDETCEKCGKPMILRNGRRGPFLGCSGYPKCRTIVNLDDQLRAKLTAAGIEVPDGGDSKPSAQPTAVPCPECGEKMILRSGRRGPFLGCGAYPKCKKIVNLTDELKEQLAEQGIEVE